MVLNINSPFHLESGDVLPQLTIAYHTFGTLNAESSNVIWVCHALTANSDVADWWPHTVEAGCFLDPNRYFIVCANILGSHYGTTGPMSINPDTGEPYYDTFPQMTVRDMVRAHQLLASHLGITCVELLIGSSLGGFQCMEWTLMEPSFPKRIALIATSAVTSPWAAGFNETQRMTILADSSYGEDSPSAGLRGLAAARANALLSYRGSAAYNLTQSDQGAETDPANPFRRRVHSYQVHQGDKLCARFNAYSYFRLTRAVDSHDVGRGRGGVANALAGIKAKTLVVGITSDILFTLSESEELARFIPNAHLETIESDFGHDGFLVEHQKLNTIINQFMKL